MAINKLPKGYSSDFRALNKKPVGAFEIDPNHPLAEYVNSVQAVGYDGREFSGPDAFISTAGANQGYESTNSNTVTNWSFPESKPVSVLDTYSVFTVFHKNLGTNSQSGAIYGERPTANQLFWVFLSGTNVNFWTRNNAGGGLITFGATAELDTSKRVHTTMFVKESDSSRLIYADDNTSTNNTNSGGTYISSTPNLVGDGFEASRATAFVNVMLNITFNKALTPSDYRMLKASPYAIFRPKTAPVYFTADTGGSTITVPATLGTISYAGQSTTVSITGSIDITATLGTIAYTSNSTAVDISGSVDVIATLGAIDYTSNNTTVGIAGSVDVTTTLGTISYTSNNTTVSVSGAVDVIATLGTISYASNNTAVGITGSVDALTTLGTITYTSVRPIVSIGGTIVVPSTLGTITYSSNDTVISLQGVVSVPATLGTISYSSNNTVVSLAGLIDVNATLGTISYTSDNTTVTVAAGQTFGVVGVGFAGDLYSSTFKPDSITVTFRG